MGLVLQVDQSNEGRSEFLAVRCSLLEQSGSGAVIFATMDLTEAAGADGVGCCDAGQDCQPRRDARHFGPIWLLGNQFRYLQVSLAGTQTHAHVVESCWARAPCVSHG